PSARLRDYLALAKLRIVALVLVVTLFGFLMAAHAALDGHQIAALLHTLIGTALAAAGANALNQHIERAHDAVMQRTRFRPLPAGRIAPRDALLLGVAAGTFGVSYLAVLVGTYAALLTAGTFLSYVLLYTPLKRVTPWSLLVGAVPGALPPLIGWSAAAGRLDHQAWLLFGIMYLWQIPHFLAIAWRYRDDYARAGFPMLSVVDPSGRQSARHIVFGSMALLLASLLPNAYHMSGPLYFAGALLLGAAFLLFGVAVALRRTPTVARWHLLASLVYLPAIFGIMLIDRI
ncbi:MAG TPA: heme o synthase, partial [Burkholderiaceae bacterium]|nr:heme o synthase [Burkholderiaceae bacterium]